MKVKVINHSNYPLPQYKTAGAAGLDVHAATTEPIVLGSLERALVPTGLYVEVPQGYEMQVRPRSGLAAKHGITVANAPGTIDSDYRGPKDEVKVQVQNISGKSVAIERGERIGQAMVIATPRLEFEEIDQVDAPSRGGFGSTGV